MNETFTTSVEVRAEATLYITVDEDHSYMRQILIQETATINYEVSELKVILLITN